ncbi:hypothetical protein GGR55DRAFT_654451 [Xylaria sp. FL0064]|nr:hypothetical protein GGR55DRAFT_654451 [Xylaria sp. FL0064]
MTRSTHMYKNGIPILVDDPCSPRFMKSTSVLYRRNTQLLIERVEREKRAEQQATWRLGDRMRQLFSSDSEWDSRYWEVEEPPEETPPSPAPLPTPPLTPTTAEIEGKIEVEIEKEKSLAERTRLHEKLEFSIRILTDSKKSLGYLRRAAEIVQKSIFDAHKNGLSGRWDLEDGPHLVRLGRNELWSWLGDEDCHFYSRPNWSTLAYNGQSGYTVYHAILEVVELRNTISHPHGSELRDAKYVDWLLGSAQNVCVVPGDEKGALEIRDM